MEATGGVQRDLAIIPVYTVSCFDVLQPEDKRSAARQSCQSRGLVLDEGGLRRSVDDVGRLTLCRAQSVQSAVHRLVADKDQMGEYALLTVGWEILYEIGR